MIRPHLSESNHSRPICDPIKFKFGICVTWKKNLEHVFSYVSTPFLTSYRLQISIVYMITFIVSIAVVHFTLYFVKLCSINIKLWDLEWLNKSTLVNPTFSYDFMLIRHGCTQKKSWSKTSHWLASKPTRTHK